MTCFWLFYLLPLEGLTFNFTYPTIPYPHQPPPLSSGPNAAFQRRAVAPHFPTGCRSGLSVVRPAEAKWRFRSCALEAASRSFRTLYPQRSLRQCLLWRRHAGRGVEVGPDGCAARRTSSESGKSTRGATPSGWPITTGKVRRIRPRLMLPGSGLAAGIINLPGAAAQSRRGLHARSLPQGRRQQVHAGLVCLSQHPVRRVSLESISAEAQLLE